MREMLKLGLLLVDWLVDTFVSESKVCSFATDYQKVTKRSVPFRFSLGVTREILNKSRLFHSILIGPIAPGQRDIG